MKRYRPTRRLTLVGALQRDINRSADAGPDWPTIVENAVITQDMSWVNDQMAVTDELVWT